MNEHKNKTVPSPSEMNISKLNAASNQLKITIVFVVLCNFLGFVILLISVYIGVHKYSKRVYTLHYNQTEKGLLDAQESPIHNKYEVENFVKLFLKLMYSHDANTFQKRVETAMQYVSKEDGQAIADDFAREQLLEQYIRSGAGIKVEVDSIWLDMQTLPYEGVAYSRQIVFNGSREIAVPFGIRFEVGLLPKTSQNPFGLQLRKLNFFKYKFFIPPNENIDLKKASSYEKELMPLEENMESETQTKATERKN